MILPERVFGRSADQMIRLGRASLPIRFATWLRMSCSSCSSPSFFSPFRVSVPLLVVAALTVVRAPPGRLQPPHRPLPGLVHRQVRAVGHPQERGRPHRTGDTADVDLAVPGALARLREIGRSGARVVALQGTHCHVQI